MLRQNNNYISEWIASARRVLLANFFAAKLLNGAGIFIYSVFFALIADYFMPLPFSIRSKFLPASFAAFIGYSFFVFLKSGKITRFFAAVYAVKKHPALDDDLLNAYSFISEPLNTKLHSIELEQKFLEFVSRKVSDIDVKSFWEYKSLRRGALNLAAGLILMSAGIFSPCFNLKGSFMRLFSPNNTSGISQFLKVKSGNINVPYNGTAQINLVVENEPEAGIEILAKKGKNRWQALKPERYANGAVAAFILNVTENWVYYAKIRDLKSEVYKITPISLPQIEKQFFSYKFPSYTRIPAETRENEYEIHALKGTIIAVKTVFTKPLISAQLKFKSGKTLKMAAVAGDTFRQEFTLSQNDVFYYDCLDTDGISDGSPALMPVTAEDDLYPRISIISPNSDIVAAAAEVVAFNLECSDDYGLSSLDFKWKNRKEASFYKKNIMSEAGFSAGVLNEPVSYDWVPADYGFKPGDTVDYYFELYDNDAVSGPKSTASGRFSIEIADFEGENKLIEEELKRWRDSVLELAGEEEALGKSVAKLSDSASEPHNIAREYAAGQDALNSDLKRVGEKLSKIVQKMRFDPLTGSRVLNEHTKIKENIDYMASGYGQEAIEKITARSFEQAAKIQQTIADELKKAALLSEDIIQYQNMKKIMESSSDMEDKAQNLIGELEALSREPSNEQAEKLNNILNQINELMSQMMKNIKDLPQDLPEEFMNSESIKNMDFGKAQDSINSLAQALARGDTESALKYAAQLLKEIQSMIKSIDEAAAGAGSMSLSDNINSEVKRRFAEYEQLVIEQTDVAAKMRELEQSSLRETDKMVRDILKSLSLKQKEAVSIAENTGKKLKPEPGYMAEFGFYTSVIAQMKKVLEEFESRKLKESDILLKAVIGYFEGLKKIAADDIPDASASELGNDAQKIIDIEREILLELDKIKSGLTVAPDDKQLEILAAYKDIENKLGARTSKLKDGLERISRNTAEIEPSVMDNLSQASGYMGDSAEFMSKGDIKSARNTADRALDSLSKAGKTLENAMQPLGEMGAGGRPGPKVFFKQGAGRGQKDFGDSYVPIPGKNEYVPPKKFREEILKSLEEKYPEIHKDTVEKYYKKLVE